MDLIQDLLTSFVQMPAVWAAAWCGVLGYVALRAVDGSQKDHDASPDQDESRQVCSGDEAGRSCGGNGRANG